ncbi:MAG: xanthine dehydrogenase family protein subunit M [Planctomycetota bacterium]
MYLPDFQLHEPATLDEAAALLVRYGRAARVLAGGTDLLVDLKTGRVRVGHLIALRRLEALRGVRETAAGVSIGALTTITELAAAPLVLARLPALADAAAEMAGPQIRNVATVGGNIASAVPCADLPPVLIALGASVVLVSGAGRRELPLEGFFRGPRQTLSRDEEMLVEVRVPHQPPCSGAAYARLGLRAGNAIPVAAVAASLSLDRDGRVAAARIVLGAVAPVPRLVPAAAEALSGRPASEERFAAGARLAREAAEPISDVRGSAEYRRALVEVLARRALRAAYARAQENSACPSRAG